MDLQTKGFQLPDNIIFETEGLTNTYGKFSAEAFERGFGATLGNALRRVMLSSIEGAAVTSIRIPGALHEFTTISGVKEDVVDILLNVKLLRFKSHSDDSQVITVEEKGPGEITGKDSNVDFEPRVTATGQSLKGGYHFKKLLQAAGWEVLDRFDG